MSDTQEDFDRRRKELWNFLHKQAVEAERLVDQLRVVMRDLHNTTETPEEKFSEGLQVIQNFMKNIDFAHAVKLSARCAAAEQRLQ